MSTHSARLAELGIELPAVAAPLAAYQPAVRSGNHVYTSGQLPMVDGNLATAGKVGAEVSPEDAKALARICALNAVAAVDALVGINNVVKVVKVVGFVASAPGFTGQPGVVNGASGCWGRYSGSGRACAFGGWCCRVADQRPRGSRDRGGGPRGSVRIVHPAYGQLRPVTETASVLLANNPGMMTLEGTNTWVLRAPGSDEIVIVDPGPGVATGDPDVHVEQLAKIGKVALVLVSHRHFDHTGGVDRLVELTGAPARAVDPAWLRGDSVALIDGERIDVAGLSISVLATPGHSDDSVSFVLDDAVLTADTILGRGTTVIAQDGGGLGDYLESLKRLEGLGKRTVLPGHGPELSDLSAASAEYLAHREQRLDQVRAALAALGEDASARQVVEFVYTDVDPSLWGAAEWSVQAQLDYLRTV